MLSKESEVSADKIIQLEQLVIHLKSELAQHKLKIKKLKKAEEESELGEIRGENEYLLRKLETVQKIAQEAEEEKDQYKKEFYDLKNKYQKLILEMGALHHQLSDSEYQNKKLESLRDELMKENESLNETVNSTIFAEIESHYRKLENSFSSMLTEFSSKNEHHSQLIEKTHEVIKSLAQSLKVDYEKQHGAEIFNEFKSSFLPLHEALEQLTTKMSLFYEQAQIQNEKTDHFQGEISNFTEKVNLFKTSIENLSSDIHELKKKEADLEQELRQLQKENTQYQEREKQLQKKIETLNQSLTRYSEEEYGYTQKINILEAEIAEFSSKEAALHAQLEHIDIELAQEKEQQQNYSSKIEMLNKEIETLTANEKKLLDKIYGLESELALEKEQQQNYYNKIEVLNMENEKFTVIEKEYIERMENLEKKVVEMEKEAGKEKQDSTSHQAVLQQTEKQSNHSNKITSNDQKPEGPLQHQKKLFAKQLNKQKQIAKNNEVSSIVSDKRNAPPHRSKQMNTKKENNLRTLREERKSPQQHKKHSLSGTASFKFSRSEPMKNSSHEQLGPLCYQKPFIDNQLSRQSHHNQIVSIGGKNPLQKDKYNTFNSLNIFYEKNPLYNNPSTQHHSINPFNRSKKSR